MVIDFYHWTSVIEKVNYYNTLKYATVNSIVDITHRLISLLLNSQVHFVYPNVFCLNIQFIIATFIDFYNVFIKYIMYGGIMYC